MTISNIKFLTIIFGLTFAISACSDGGPQEATNVDNETELPAENVNPADEDEVETPEIPLIENPEINNLRCDREVIDYTDREIFILWDGSIGAEVEYFAVVGSQQGVPASCEEAAELQLLWEGTLDDENGVASFEIDADASSLYGKIRVCLKYADTFYDGGFLVIKEPELKINPDDSFVEKDGSCVNG